MTRQWVPLHGEFDLTQPPNLVFKGRSHEYVTQAREGPDASATKETGPLFGVALTPWRMADGRVSATFTFSDAAARTTGEVVLAQDVTTKYQLVAGINTTGRSMFNIREWITSAPGQDSTSQQSGGSQPFWRPLDVSGDSANLETGRAYRVEAGVLGSRVWLSVDGVLVAAGTLPSTPPYVRHTGVWCRSMSDILVSDFSVSTDKPRAFVVIKFGQPFFDVHSDVIKGVCGEFGLEAIHGGEVFGPGIVIKDIVDQILRSQVVIAEISEGNANVYFEVGYALAMNKPIILLAETGTTLPFDVSGFRVLYYENSIGGRGKLLDGLRNHLKAVRA